MKDFIKLHDGTTVEIEDNASFDRIVHIAANEEAAVEVCSKLTYDNLKTVEFWNGGAEMPHSVYDNLTLNYIPTRQTNVDGTVIVVISLREKNALELRLDALEESQATQDGAIEDLGAAVSDMMEG